MIAEMTVRMDRSVDLDHHYISPGDFEVTANEKQYQFGFCLSNGYVHEEDPTIVSFTLEEPDYAAFPDMAELKNNLNKITKFDDFYIFTGEEEDPEINPVELLSFCIRSDNNVGDGISHNNVESSEYIRVIDNYEYEFLSPLLNDVNRKYHTVA